LADVKDIGEKEVVVWYSQDGRQHNIEMEFGNKESILD
jgi:hypothetical protein